MLMAKAASRLIGEILDPVLAKRAGISLALVNAWSEIVGEELAISSMPIKVKWKRRVSEEDEFEPGTLHVASEGMAALHLQHQTQQIIDRVNAFLGYPAINRVKLVQKPVASVKPAGRKRPITPAQQRKIDALTDSIEDDELKAAMKRFGENVIRGKKKP